MKIARVAAGWGLAVVLLTAAGCGHAAGTEPAPRASAATPRGAAKDGEAPSLIAVRALVVAYQGAPFTGASAQRTQAEALERARMLATMARQGDKLAELVVQYSDRAGANEDQGVFKLRTTDPAPWSPAVVQAALALPVGGISEPVGAPGGYAVLERLPDPPAGPERIAARHILITYAGSAKSVAGVTRSEAEARALAEQVATQAQQPGSAWNALAEQYTEEPGGKERAGDLGKFGRGAMVPAFERAAFALEVGQISAVVESPFGFHVIQRYE
jgi:parvulin-like peptidyl-prolyl isomerase